MPTAENWCANYGGDFGVDQCLAAHDNETAIKFRISAGMMNPIDVASLHRRPIVLALYFGLITEDVFNFLR
jgi:hypothetical protein